MKTELHLSALTALAVGSISVASAEPTNATTPSFRIESLKPAPILIAQISKSSPAQDYEQPADTSEEIIAPKTVTGDSVMDLIRENPNFTNLTLLLEETELDSAISAATGVTVFAPTDQAFARLSEAELKALKAEENREKLKSLLLFHVTDTEFVASDVTNPLDLRTIEGSKLRIETLKESDETTILLGSLAKVTVTDMTASNGQVHAIDRVLRPDANSTPTPETVSDGEVAQKISTSEDPKED